MPGLNYLSQSGDTQPFSQMGQAAGSIAFASPVMQLQAERLKQQMVLQKARQILMEAQTKAAMAHGGLYQQQQQTDKTKQEGMQSTQKSADAAGQAETYRQVISGSETPPLESMQGALQLIGQQGVGPAYDPNQPTLVPRGGIVEALQAIERGAATRNALSSPGSAATFLTPRNAPVGGTMYNSMGSQVGQGRTPDIKVNPNQTVYPQGDTENPVRGVLSANKGQSLFEDDGSPLVQGLPSQGNTRSIADQVQIDALHAASRAAETGGPKMADRAGRAVLDFSTNLPSMKVNSGDGKEPPHPALKGHTPGPVPPPHMRKVGDKIQTAKGIFAWNGQGWDPVAPPTQTPAQAQ